MAVFYFLNCHQRVLHSVIGPHKHTPKKISKRNELNVWAQTGSPFLCFGTKYGCREVICKEANGNKHDKGSLALKQESGFVGSV